MTMPVTAIARGSQPVYLVHQPAAVASPAVTTRAGRPVRMARCDNHRARTSHVIQVTSVRAVRLYRMWTSLKTANRAAARAAGSPSQSRANSPSSGIRRMPASREGAILERSEVWNQRWVSSMIRGSPGGA